MVTYSLICIPAVHIIWLSKQVYHFYLSILAGMRFKEKRFVGVVILCFYLEVMPEAILWNASRECLFSLFQAFR